jgi:hypothetical protein
MRDFFIDPKTRRTDWCTIVILLVTAMCFV